MKTKVKSEKVMKYKNVFFMVCVLAVLSGCQTVADVVVKTSQVVMDPSIKVGEDEDQPTKISLSIYASSRVNVNQYIDDSDESNATPLSFKVIQLKDDSIFQGADFDAMFDDMKDALGSTYLDHDDYEMEPGKFKFIDFEEIDKETKFIAVFALYNDPDNTKWKSVIKVKPKGNEYSLFVYLQSKKVVIKKK